MRGGMIAPRVDVRLFCDDADDAAVVVADSRYAVRTRQISSETIELA